MSPTLLSEAPRTYAPLAAAPRTYAPLESGTRTNTSIRGLAARVRGVTYASEVRAIWASATHAQRRELTVRAAAEDVAATRPARYAPIRGLGALSSEQDPSVVTGTLAPADPDLGSDGWPAWPGFRPGNWRGGRPTIGKDEYMLAFGDTFSGLSAGYLGGPGRWREIWEAGGNRDRFDSPDKIPAGAWIDMPPEATAAAVAMMGDADEARLPASPGAPGSVPGASDPADEAPGTTWSTGKKVAAGVAAAALLGGIVYAAS